MPGPEDRYTYTKAAVVLTEVDASLAPILMSDPAHAVRDAQEYTIQYDRLAQNMIVTDVESGRRFAVLVRDVIGSIHHLLDEES